MRSLIILGIFSIISLSFLLLLFVPQVKNAKIEENNSNKSSFYFKNDIIYSNCKDSQETSKIFLNSYNTKVSEFQIELSYDPEIIYDIEILNKLASNNTEVTLNDIRPKYARASFAVSLSKPIKINNAVAVVNFKTYSSLSSTSAQIKFLNKSSVTPSFFRKSILTSYKNLNIYCN